MARRVATRPRRVLLQDFLPQDREVEDPVDSEESEAGDIPIHASTQADLQALFDEDPSREYESREETNARTPQTSEQISPFPQISHWTADTGSAMLDHWMEALNSRTPRVLNERELRYRSPFILGTLSSWPSTYKLRLTGPQRSILEKGLSFIPSVDVSRDQKIQLEFNIQNYHRKIKLATYFRNDKEKEKNIYPFIGSSSCHTQQRTVHI